MNMHSRSVELTNTALWLLALLPLCSDHICKTMSQPWHFAAGDVCFVILQESLRVNIYLRGRRRTNREVYRTFQKTTEQ